MSETVGLRRVAGAALLSFLSAGPAGAQSLENLADELIRLRGDVDQLNSQLEIEREQHRSELSSLAVQKGDLEATINREELNIRQLQSTLEENRRKAEEAGVAGEVLVPILLDSIERLRAHIEDGLPFKVEGRLAELDRLEDQIVTGGVPAYRAANRLWAFYEDEFRLTRENGIHAQTIRLDDERVFAAVAKIGMVMLFFETDDGEAGLARRTPDGWEFELVSSRKDRERIATLFDSLRKQIRAGFFELPNPWASAGAG